jgi:hypothetical protein
MRRRAARLWVVGVWLLIAGCRQADGTVPVASGEQPNKIIDIGRDLQNAANGSPDAATDLQADLDGLDSRSKPPLLVRDLSQAVTAALRGRTLSEAQSQEIARSLFVLVAGRELSRRQIDQVSTAFRQTVVSTGADPAAAERAANAASALAGQTSENRKRWYHVF